MESIWKKTAELPEFHTLKVVCLFTGFHYPQVAVAVL